MKLFLLNLPLKFTEAHLRMLLEEHCTIMYLELMTGHETGLSKGIAFLQVANDREGRFLIAALNGFLIRGRPMYVSEDKGLNPESQD